MERGSFCDGCEAKKGCVVLDETLPEARIDHSDDWNYFNGILDAAAQQGCTQLPEVNRQVRREINQMVVSTDEVD